ncbi:hypothetical protein ACQKMI_18150 [Lysinibacillus sp. NPDC097214]
MLRPENVFYAKAKRQQQQQQQHERRHDVGHLGNTQDVAFLD